MNEQERYFCDHENYCQGYLDSPNNGYYVLLTHLAAVGVEKTLETDGLNSILAFDKAEIEGRNVGQTNAIVVSSFCGVNGKIWGLDMCKKKLDKIDTVDGVSVYDGEKLLEATTQLLGTVSKKRFPILPGSQLPSAMKYMYLDGPGLIYSLIAIGIPKDRNTSACILMEDVGEMNEEKEFYRKTAAKSVLAIAKNQRIECKEILFLFRSAKIKKGSKGCALVMAPYIKLAKSARKLI